MEIKDNDFKKSYKLLVIYMLSFFVILIIFSFIIGFFGESIGEKTVSMFFLHLNSLFIWGISFMIYKTERVYYYNYISYEKANKAGSEARKKYAYIHMRIFTFTFLIFIIYTGVSYIFNINILLDTLVWTILVITAAISTIMVKL